ncbi:hypothetical protein KQI74_12165 [Paenibacillus barcinonensis]|nr:hypothetical protein [Paenibacillus barcinonensis]MBU5353046.1 hypothetical protein [Paenibacillus barcinonensis]
MTARQGYSSQSGLVQFSLQLRGFSHRFQRKYYNVIHMDDSPGTGS